MARNYSEILSDNIQLRLKDRTAYWLAKTAPVSQSLLSRLLSKEGRSEANPGLDVIVKIAAALNCEPWQLIADLETASTLVKLDKRNQDMISNQLVLASQLQKKTMLQEEAIRGLSAQIQLLSDENEKLKQRMMREDANAPPLPADIRKKLFDDNINWNNIRGVLKLPFVEEAKSKKRPS